ncbi:MAG: TraR/DksA C4-type zinc finger protein [Eudoraea sp.]|nr:TraR/DksA C4-type zinc finger protein [Eudoraea sp.]
MKTEELRELLEAEISKAKKKIARYEEMTGPVAPDNAIGRVSRMDAINNKGVMDAALRKARQSLQGLHNHLNKLGTPDFGSCVKCEQNIPIQRILLAPESSVCVNCARI